ncbi:hypothetical protein PAAG_04188 [Paracoccidioides lutzii Pb01]|uniref:Uncharacterized protein n=1 Tax=Paracoccidioides lutzii (strain ATCC MYA-826 / Pb01) TaxID=502779 RepID=C1H094_PARBA|nr:hypothetical protein PAAG_04188 [Paracoccidioides lutzii Pb01]EEH33135.2 hypothetical protein PAAG_04188 [Paracoccidioides lutzii Pb01]
MQPWGRVAFLTRLLKLLTPVRCLRVRDLSPQLRAKITSNGVWGLLSLFPGKVSPIGHIGVSQRAIWSNIEISDSYQYPLRPSRRSFERERWVRKWDDAPGNLLVFFRIQEWAAQLIIR